jgi:ATP-binding cassette, subfamily G (WHITE), member 2, PDR
MIVYLLAAEYIASDGSKGEKLVFQNRRDIQNLGAANNKDEETAHGSEAHETPSRVLREKPNSGDSPARTNVLHWRSVCYDITIKSEPRRILDDVSGWVKPGTLTALMVSPD